MSRTYRRKTGYQWFAYNSKDQTLTNPYYHCPSIQIHYEYVTETKEGFGNVWCWLEQKYVPRTYEHKIPVVVKTPIDCSRSSIEMLEKHIDAIEYDRRGRMDGKLYRIPARRLVKEDSKRISRADCRAELSRIMKIEKYEDMHYIDTKRNPDGWWYLD